MIRDKYLPNYQTWLIRLFIGIMIALAIRLMLIDVIANPDLIQIIDGVKTLNLKIDAYAALLVAIAASLSIIDSIIWLFWVRKIVKK